MTGFDELRQRLTSEGCASYSSLKYQDDVLRFISENADRGGDIIEVGCYKGGMTVQLAWAAKLLGARVQVVDTSIEWVTHSRDLLKSLNLYSHSHFWCGTLDYFSVKLYSDKQPLCLVLDADHSYASVMKDIIAIKKINPYAVAFHDFSLRHESNKYGVDRAIYDSFGRDVELVKIGETVDEFSSFPRVPYHPAKGESLPEDGWYWEENGQEGVILVMNGQMPKGAQL